MRFGKRIDPLLRTVVIAAVAVFLVLLWNYSVTHHGNVLGFYRIGTVLPFSPYVTPSDEVLAKGEVGYDGELFLSLAMDPTLSHPGTLASLDNPRYRYRRVLFPAVGYALSLGQRQVIPFALVLINLACFVGLVFTVARMLFSHQKSVWNALFVLGVPGYWCALLLTTSDLMAALLLALSLSAYMNRRFKLLALCYALAALTHETMLVVVGALLLPLLVRRQWRPAAILLAGSVPPILWNIFVIWYVPASGSSSGVMENFAFPFAGIVHKLIAASAGPISAKWIFDTSSFALLCATFIVLGISLVSKRRLQAIWPCALAYLGFFAISKMQILSYYLDFLRVYGSVVLLLIVSLQYSQAPRVAKLALLTWSVLSAVLVAAFSMSLI